MLERSGDWAVAWLIGREKLPVKARSKEADERKSTQSA